MRDYINPAHCEGAKVRLPLAENVWELNGHKPRFNDLLAAALY